MPKDEFDFDDPMELSGVALATEEDTTDLMCECFVEEFMRLGYNAKQILALFRNPHYLGMNMVLQNRGEPFVRDRISDVFARWGKPVAAGFQPNGTGVECANRMENPDAPADANANPGGQMPPSTAGRMPAATDPMGAPIPDVTS